MKISKQYFLDMIVQYLLPRLVSGSPKLVVKEQVKQSSDR